MAGFEAVNRELSIEKGFGLNWEMLSQVIFDE
jgi:hypothetical protein